MALSAKKQSNAGVGVRSSIARNVWFELALWAALLIVGGAWAWLSVSRYLGYNAGMFDLGNMAQAIASVNRGQSFIFTYRDGQMSRLALHVELIYLLFVPLMRLWSDPQVLLIGQALLAASGALPVYRMAGRRFGAGTSLAFALGYLLYPTAVAAILFDFHGDTLAMPLLLWMLDALDRQAWRRFWLFLLLSLFCKFYIAAPIFALGLTLLTPQTAPFELRDLPQRRRLGIWVCGVAVLYGLLALLVIKPLYATPASGDGGHYLRFYFGGLLTMGVLGVLERLVHLLAVLLPSALLWWWARWTALPAFAIMLPAVLSTGPGAGFAWSYHHYAAAVPFIVAGSIVGAAARRDRITNPRLRLREARAAGALFLATTLIFHVGLNDTPLGIGFWQSQLGNGRDASGYGRTERDALKDRWLAEHVPPQAKLAVSNFLAPHLFAHDTLYLIRYPDDPKAGRLPKHLPQVDLVVADALFDYVEQTASGFVGGVAYDLDAIRQLLRAPGWSLTAARDGLLRFEQGSTATAALPQSIQLVEDTGAARAQFSDSLALMQGSVEPLGGRRFRATFRWRALRDFKPGEQMVAVSTLAGVAHTRIAHLPSYALQPASSWRAGQVWEEQFELELPADLAAGRYEWQVGWYDTASPYAAQTDARSRLGELATVTSIDLR